MTLLDKLIPIQKEYHNTITQIQSLMIKATKDKNKIDLLEVQQIGTILMTKHIKESVDFYNTYIRKEGEKVLIEEEYITLMSKLKKLKEKTINKFNQYPLILDECFPATKEDFYAAIPKEIIVDNLIVGTKGDMTNLDTHIFTKPENYKNEQQKTKE